MKELIEAIRKLLGGGQSVPDNKPQPIDPPTTGNGPSPM